MFGIDQTTLIFIGLATVTVFALGYGLLYNSIETAKKADARMKSMQVDRSTKQKVRSKAMDEKQRRKQREDTLKNVDQQRAAGKKADDPSLSVKMVQAGMTMNVKTLHLVFAGIGLFVAFALFAILKTPIYIAIGALFAIALGLPRWFVNFKRNRRFNAFTLVFPNAIDIIVRGIRSGLPLNDCMRIIAADADEPVRTEFRKMLEAMQMGITVPDACERLYESVPTAETNFFSIVIAIQSSAGGNLSEALGNLSKVLRERRKMADKIKAVSTEAKTSAMIIGALPFIVAGLIWATSPNYMEPLWYTSAGNKVLFGCAISMGIGIAIMKKMINFKF